MARHGHDSLVPGFEPLEKVVDPVGQLCLGFSLVGLEDRVFFFRHQRKVHHRKLPGLLRGRPPLVAGVDPGLFPDRLVSQKGDLPDQFLEGNDARLQGPAVRGQNHQLGFLVLTQGRNVLLDQRRLLAPLAGQRGVRDFRHHVGVLFRVGDVHPGLAGLRKEVRHEVVESLAVAEKVCNLDVLRRVVDGGSLGIVHCVGPNDEWSLPNLDGGLGHSFQVDLVIVLGVGDCRFGVAVAFVGHAGCCCCCCCCCGLVKSLFVRNDLSRIQS
mmetsp:Transcript_108055/g.220602  ORF Transcript_108055/g.220602 Transcript_108055/m.220602 type:complete len:269 (+) Transcript_108055:3228-4034(+)